LFQNTDKYPNAEGVKFNSADWSHWGNEPIVELAKTIYAEGLLNPYVPGTSADAKVKVTTENNGAFIEKGDKLEINISLEVEGGYTKAKLTLPDEIKNLVKSGKGAVTVDC
jgi:hypothetical protein